MADEQIIIDVNLITADSAKNLQELTAEIEALEDAFKGADFGTEEFDRLGRQLAEKRGQVIQFDKELEQMQGPQFMAEKFVKMGEGIAGAFAAAQGAAAIFGKDNEKLEQSIVKVQGAVAIAVGARSIAESGFIQIIAKSNALKRVKNALDNNGLKTLRQSTLATKALGLAQKGQAVAQRLVNVATQAFGKALIATGIGAIVVGIGTLVANWDKLNGTVRKAVEVFLKFNPVIGGIVKVFNTLKSAVQGVAEGLGLVADEQTKAAKKLAETADQEITDAAKAADRRIALEESKGNEVTKLQRKSLEKQLAIAKAAHEAMQANKKSFTEEELKEAETRYLDLDNALKVHNNEQLKLAEEAEEERKKKASEAAEEARKKREEEQAQELADREAAELRLLEMTAKQTESLEDFQALQAELRQRDIDNFKGTAEQKAEFELLRQQQELQAIAEFQQKLADVEQQKADKEAAEQEEKEKERQEEINRANQHALQIANIQAGLDGEITTEEKIELQRLQFRARMDAMNEEDKANKELVEALEKEHQQKLNDIRKEGDQASLDEAQETRQKRLEIAQGALNAVTSMGNALMALSEANDKQGEVSVRKQKKRARQKLLMDQANAIMGAVAGGMTQPFPANIFAVATGVAAVVANFANAKKAMSQIGEDVGGGDSASVSAGGGVGAGATIPSAPPSVTGPSGTQQTTEDVFGEGTMPRAFVVESDMTSAQEAAQKTNDLATL